MRVDDHAHCKVCGKLVEAGESTCSEECEEKRARMRSTRQNYTYLMYGMIGLLLLFLILGYVR